VSPQLAAIIADFERAQRRLHALVDTFPTERWSRRRGADRWSVAECVAHLNLTSHAFLPILKSGIAQARTLGAPQSVGYRRSAMGRLIGFAAGPMPRIGRWRFGRVKTAAAFVPGGTLPHDTVVAEFDALQREQIELTRQADGLPIDRVRIVSPFDARVKYDLFSAFALLPAHQRRHIEQAEEIWK
jgi:hypothetical protein